MTTPLQAAKSELETASAALSRVAATAYDAASRDLMWREGRRIGVLSPDRLAELGAAVDRWRLASAAFVDTAKENQEEMMDMLLGLTPRSRR